MTFLSGIVSGLVAGWFAIVITALIERCGGMVGGVLGTVPSTIVPAAIGLARTFESTDQLHEALFSVPLGIFLDATFLWTWKYFPKRLPMEWTRNLRLGAMLTISLTIWIILALVAWTFQNQILGKTNQVRLAGVICLLCTLIFGMIVCWKPGTMPRGRNAVSVGVLVSRGLCATMAIAITIWIGKISPVLSGLMSTFPAIFVTSMTALWLSQGEDVPTGAVGPMMLGSLSVPTFAIIFGLTATKWGIPGAVLFAWVIAVSCISFPVTMFLKWRRKKVDSENLQHRYKRVNELALDEEFEEIELDRVAGLDDENLGGREESQRLTQSQSLHFGAGDPKEAAADDFDIEDINFDSENR
eukprot:gb/GECG01010711.1/.p1 GENE.gb/GECG01010711.1/~~gb/GECG01010711.1/.p1  ORF type:complete len:357 (+),score=28.26 gb/GECG01010711.1/:1-1071(+)